MSIFNLVISFFFQLAICLDLVGLWTVADGIIQRTYSAPLFLRFALFAAQYERAHLVSIFWLCALGAEIRTRASSAPRKI